MSESKVRVSRRNFITGALVGAVSAGSAGMVTAAEAAPQAQTSDYDVVVVGAGAAGLWAALDAGTAGVKVALLEKQESSLLSGCALCGGAVLASNTKAQKAAGIKDTVEAHLKDHMRISRSTCDPELSRIYCQESAAVVDWLYDAGVTENLIPWPLNHETITARAHWTKTGESGKPWVAVLNKAIGEKKNITVFYKTPGKKLVTKNGRVTGIIATDKDGKEVQFNAKAVVLCTGGFPHNHDMLEQYGFNHSEGIPGAPGCTGDGILMAQPLGAVLKDMRFGMNYYWLKGSILGGMVPAEFLMINVDARRFVGEHSGYMLTLPRVIDQPDGVVWAIFNTKIADAMKYKPEDLKKAEDSGLLLKSATLEDLGRLMIVDPLAFAATVKDYNYAAATGNDEQFGKPAAQLRPIDSADFYAARVWLPRPTLTYGGMTINAKAQVVDRTGTPIPGLYAAGDDTAGLLGRYYPGSGTAIGSAMVFGRVAGRNAAVEKGS